MTDCTLAELAAGLAAARRGPDAWRLVPLLPARPGLRVGLRGLRRWMAAAALPPPRLVATGGRAAQAAVQQSTVPSAAAHPSAGPSLERATPPPGRDSRPPLLRSVRTEPAAARENPAARERAALVARARAGDTHAFGLLYDHYAELVFRYALYRLNGDPAAAEDIVSETFLRAFRMIGQFRWQGRDIGAWFITIARNLVVDQARSARRRMEIPTADLRDAAEGTTAGAVPGPEESILAGLTHRELLDAVRRLRPDQQECVSLRFLEGMSVRETAHAMGRNEGAVRALQLRAVRALARTLAQAGSA
ncbi:sigma-70 family RNA polymerase sigma factor [Frankia sp. AgB32]|uniref:sigma-70 family RNA polymerase sigma factor n=1 Tax=Frankia sp. AgB32 TaxID=631119 RepID=UPI00200F9FCE|nr:sigma-70 family RNA polymerase sigma factor [Frankia sp. AgB32]MCK9894253.1 sigma-70 family RNA polymerase sigma factor [Frankia sp. AgB32]